MKKIIVGILIGLGFLGLLAGELFAASARVMPVAYNTSTFGDATRDYTGSVGLTSWEAATDIDLVTATSGEVLECYPDEAIYDQRVEINGATTNASYFRVVKAATGHERDVIFTQDTESITDIGTFYVYEPYFGLYDLTVRSTHTLNGSYAGCQTIVVNGANNCRIVGCALDSTVSSYGNGTIAVGINLYSVTGAKVIDTYISNVSCAHTPVAAYGIYFYSQSGGEALNCLIYDAYQGMIETGGAGAAKNTIIHDVTVTKSGTVNETTCLFTTGAGLVVFDADGYHLDASDTAATGQGTNLSVTFTDDIDGDTFGAAWDIGVDHYVAPAASTGAVVSIW